jgi:hypothetical protein
LSGLWPLDLSRPKPPKAGWLANLARADPRPAWWFQSAREALGAGFVALLACCPAGKPCQGLDPPKRLSDTKALDPLGGRDDLRLLVMDLEFPSDRRLRMPARWLPARAPTP